ncbi:MAG: hypothetical protein Q8P86_02640 [bacterium]|nr:hypothetical protein [bacterium]
MNEQSEQRKKIIPFVVSAPLLTLAAIFDVVNGLINLIPAVGQTISVTVTVIAYMIFGLIFSLMGVRIMTKKRAARFFGPMFIEMIPIINVLPGIFLSVLLTILIQNFESKIAVVAVKNVRRGKNLQNRLKKGLGTATAENASKLVKTTASYRPPPYPSSLPKES